MNIISDAKPHVWPTLTWVLSAPIINLLNWCRKPKCLLFLLTVALRVCGGPREGGPLRRLPVRRGHGGPGGVLLQRLCRRLLWEDSEGEQTERVGPQHPARSVVNRDVRLGRYCVALRVLVFPKWEQRQLGFLSLLWISVKTNVPVWVYFYLGTCEACTRSPVTPPASSKLFHLR